MLAWGQGEYPTRKRPARENLQFARVLGQPEATAERPCGDASALRRAAGDQADVAHILSNRSRLALYTGTNARARALQDS